MTGSKTGQEERRMTKKDCSGQDSYGCLKDGDIAFKKEMLRWLNLFEHRVA